MRKNEKQLFDEAIEIANLHQRSAFLRSECGDDSALLNRVEELLEAASDVGSFMQKNAADSFDATADAPSERVGQSVGRYKLLEQIGEGGFGYVFMAEQVTPVVRKVALKVIKPGMDTKQVIARFEAERQALALMDHPNIGKILDAGATEAGRPYFVMELVRGVPITDYCAERKLSALERLELFKEVCGAIEHAHQKGIIHRDIKPSNILVYNNGERAVPKVIDFGIAKATQGRLTDKTLFTQFHQFIGTPAYMSPEQAQMSGVDVDTRSDIYSLGVLLYELLTGKTPLDLKNLNAQAYQETCRRIREDQAPVPSKRVSNLTQDERSSLADSQQTTPTEMTSRLRGDLDWIVMKALEKDRSRRYKSTDALVTDVARHLKNQPVSAGPPSVFYYLKKLLQRHRAAVTTAFAFAALLIVGTIVSVVGWGQATTAKRELSGQVETTELALSESNQLRTELQQANAELAHRIYLAHLTNADRALTSENYLRAKVELDSCSKSLRSWEWRLLSDRLDANSPAILSDAGGPVYTADGKQLITTVRSASAVRFWDTVSAEPERTLKCEYNLGRLVLSPDEKLLAGGDSLGNQIVLDLASGQQLWSRKEFSRSYSAMEFSPDGRFLASFNEQKPAIVFADATTGEERFTIPVEAAVDGIRFSQNGRWIFAERQYQTGKVVDVEKREVFKEFPHGQTRIGVHPDGVHIATGSRGGIVTVWRWDGSEFAKVRELEIPNSPIWSIHFSSDGSRLAASSRRVHFIDGSVNSVKVWNTDTGEELGAMDTPDTAWTVRFDPGQREQLAVSTTSGGLMLWRYEAQKEGLTVKPVESRAMAHFSPDGRMVIATQLPWVNALHGPLSFVDATTGEIIGKTKNGRQGANWIDERRIVCGASLERELRVYTFAGKLEATFKCSSDIPIVCACAKDDSLVAIFDDSRVGTWDLNSPNEAGALFGNSDRHPGHTLKGFAISHDNTQVAIAFWGEFDVEIWDVSSRKMVRSLPVPGQIVNGIQFAEDERSLYLGGSGGKLTKVDIASGETTKRFIDHNVEIKAIALSPTEDRLVSGDDSGKVVIWDVEYEQPLITLTSGPEPIQSLDWSADGQRILAGKKDGTVQIWTLSSS